MMAGKCILLGLFALLAREDIRTRKLPAGWLLPAGAGGLICYCCGRPFSPGSLAGGVAVGVFLLLLSAVGKGSVGAGDGAVFCVSGIILGFRGNLTLLMTSLFLAAVYAGVLLFGKHCSGKQEFAFLPFVLAAYVLMLAG